MPLRIEIETPVEARFQNLRKFHLNHELNIDGCLWRRPGRNPGRAALIRDRSISPETRQMAMHFYEIKDVKDVILLPKLITIDYGRWNNPDAHNEEVIAVIKRVMGGWANHEIHIKYLFDNVRWDRPTPKSIIERRRSEDTSDSAKALREVKDDLKRGFF